MLTGEMKARCISELQKFVGAFQERRAQVTHEVMRSFTTPRKLEYGGNPHMEKIAPVLVEANGVVADGAAADGGEKAAGKDGRGTKGERKAAKLAAKKEEKMAIRQKEQEGAS